MFASVDNHTILFLERILCTVQYLVLPEKDPKEMPSDNWTIDFMLALTVRGTYYSHLLFSDLCYNSV